MSKKHEPDNFEQMSIFGIMNLLDNTENTLSSDDISKIIDKLSDAKRKRESIEAKKRRQEEREKREREAREAKERKEAHIREVTSMDLPLDWENVFNQDVRTQGVHADSISDGLMYSLSNLGRVDIEYISSITGEDYKTITHDSEKERRKRRCTCNRHTYYQFNYRCVYHAAIPSER